MSAPGPNHRSAATDVPIHHLIRDRWSPRAFRSDPVAEADLARLFEAARWAPSSGNVQPWRYLVTHRGDASHQRLVGTLTGRNGSWAPMAPVLAAAYTLTVFPAKADKPVRSNPTAAHDLGLANAMLALQATAIGLYVHFMSGFDAAALDAAFPPPPDVVPVAVFAVGYLDEPDILPDALREKERSERTRRPRQEFVVVNGWDTGIRHA